MLLSIIVPIYNEENIIKESLPAILNLDADKEIIIVNDGSTDKSIEELDKLKGQYDFKLVNLEKNQGKGNAIRVALDQVEGKYFAICDADLEYDPKELVKLLNCAQSRNDLNLVVYGSRFLNNRQYQFHYFVNTFLTKLTNILFGSKLTDMETCFKLIPASAIKQLKLTANRFDIEPQITAQLLKNNYNIAELPISYQRRSYEEGKKIKPKDGLLAVKMLLKEKFGR